ncbi:MAG TPA: clostripain-related cysteine peptidase, partial [Pyrinomonadaceae bacterium]|nr:clostripain-related cysteine peptidase [Pyrinomonadaceae bacterium]
MIYLAGDNNLSEECVYALTELKKALPPGGTVRVLAQYDPADEFLPTQRYRIRFDSPPNNPRPIARDLIDQYPFKKENESKAAFYIRPPFGERKERKGEGGTGDPKMLYNFIAWCVDQYPKTDHYVLIVCGHGAGIYRDFLLRDNRPDGYLTISELRKALRWMHENLKDKSGDPLVLDIFGMDVCLMSMAEVTYELREYVKIAIGSESYSPAAGWPYRQTINQIDDAAKRAALQQSSQTQGPKTPQTLPQLNWHWIAKKIVKEYVRFYSDYWLAGLSVSMSAIDVRKIGRLKDLVRQLADMMILELRAEACEREKSETEKDHDYNGPGHRPKLSFADALVLAHWRAQSYNGELYVDVVDFCNCLIPYAPPYIKEACEKLVHFITHDLVLVSCTWGRHYQYSYGISIYFPWDSLMPYYGASISFPKRSRWVQFLREYIAATRRAPRRYPHSLAPQDDKRELHRILRENLSDARMGSDKMGSDKMGSDKGGNPIHSMRNPPIVFI